MGQVWSKADFDGNRENGGDGGRGSCLAVTAQNAGGDGVWGTNDDLLTPLNKEVTDISLDESRDDNAANNLDRVRGFYSFHPGGSSFVFGDGSVRYLTEGIDTGAYISMSTRDGGE